LPMLASEYQTTITNAHQLQLMALNLSANYTLGGNIDATATGSSTGATTGTDVWGSAGFVPIGASGTGGFTGTFAGAYNTINGLTITATSGSNFGLFGNIGSTGAVSSPTLTGHW
jgi:trimeric autotransporter adhesin